MVIKTSLGALRFNNRMDRIFADYKKREDARNADKRYWKFPNGKQPPINYIWDGIGWRKRR